MTKAIALIGDPVAHSVSPAMQKAACREAGLDLDYVVERIALADLSSAFGGLAARFEGLNVTRPLKEAVIPLLDEVGLEAAAAGSVNTVVFVGARTVGRSTDGAGFVAALRPVHDRPVERALILGSGGAARAVAAALLDEGARVSILARNAAAGTRLVTDLSGDRRRVSFEHLWDQADRTIERALGGCDLLVNATPIGGSNEPASCPLPAGIEPDPSTTVFDLVYRPRRTALLTRAEAVGCRTVEGIEMLVEQGARSFELWTGVDAPVAAMRAAAYAALDGQVG